LFDDQYYLLAIDGSGYFCSDKISCPHCLVRRKNGKEQYYHQVVAAVLVHPVTKQVIPIAVEPIIRSDGNSKNDCERNATGRLLKRVRKQHPKLKILVVEDGLSSNAPHIADLKAAKMHFLLGAKPGDHEHLFEQANDAMDRGDLRVERVDQAAIASRANEAVVRPEKRRLRGIIVAANHVQTGGGRFFVLPRRC